MPVTLQRTRRHALRRALSMALYEFALITLPVTLYVAIESHAKQDWSHFVLSPEWAIATIFLAVQAVALYFQIISRAGKPISAHALGALVLLALVIVVVSAINAAEALRNGVSELTASAILRLVLCLFSSLMFILLVASSRYVTLLRSSRE